MKIRIDCEKPIPFTELDYNQIFVFADEVRDGQTYRICFKTSIDFKYFELLFKDVFIEVVLDLEDEDFAKATLCYPVSIKTLEVEQM